MSDPVKTAKEGVALVGEILKVAGDNPDVRKAGNNLGQTALTLTTTINNALLPLAAVNFAIDKARVYFTEKFQQDLSSKASAIPFENIVEPRASIAGPALQGLAFSHEEQNLKDMFLSLLATAMDGRVAGDAHPAFVEIIKQLSAEEVLHLKRLLIIGVPHAIVEILLSVPDKGHAILENNLMNIVDTATGAPIVNRLFASMVDNWVRLKLVDVDYTTSITDNAQYAWVEKRPEYLKYSNHIKMKEGGITFKKGIIGRTAFGLQFAKAVGLLEK
jgi:hypothetical protein